MYMLQGWRPKLALLALFAAPSVASTNECTSGADDFKGTESVTVKAELDLGKTPAQKMIGYEKNGGTIKYALIGLFIFEDWKFLGDEAYDIDEQKLGRVSADRSTLSGGSVLETVQVLVGQSYLESHATTGIKLRIYGKKGNADMSFSASMVSEFLTCLSANR